MVGALLAGGVTSCAFLALLRIYQICVAAGEGALRSRLLLFMGLFSMAVAGVFMVGQRDFKRMLAYSSVEHMGILALGLGLGGPARLRRAAAPGQQRPDQGRALPLRRQHPPRLRQQDDRRGPRGACAGCRSPGRCSWPASWPSPARRPSARSSASSPSSTAPSPPGASSSAALFLLLLLVVFIGMGATVLHGRARATARRRARRHAVPRRPAHRRCRSSCFMAPGPAAGPVHPGPAERRCSTTPSASWRCGHDRNDSDLATLTNGRAIAAGRDARAVARRVSRRRSSTASPAASASPPCSALDRRDGRRRSSTSSWPTTTQPACTSAGRRSTATQFPSLTPRCPQVHLFEREIAEQFGLVPDRPPLAQAGALPPLVARPRRLGPRRRIEPILPGVADFYRVEGDEVHEVAVGPVHAGIIEPGHFRFQCHGEQVFHLEISLGYQHRGVERALVGGPTKRTDPLCRDAGRRHDHRPRHRLLPGRRGAGRLPKRPRAPRRCAASRWSWSGWPTTSATSARWPATSASCRPPRYCGRIRGDFLNLTALLCGSRFGRGLVRPGGVGFDVDAERARRAAATGWTRAATDTAGAVNLLWDTPSVMARFEDTGPVCRARSPIELGPGRPGRPRLRPRARRPPRPARRASSASPTSPSPPATTGDVFARAYVRWLEIQRSVAFIREQLQALPGGRRRGAARAARARQPRRRPRSKAGAARSATWRMTDAHGPLRALQGRRPLVPQLDRPGLRPARPADLRLPALQQELQPVLLRARPVSGARNAMLDDHCSPACSRATARSAYPDGPPPALPDRFRGRPVARRRQVPGRLPRLRRRPARPAPSPSTGGRRAIDLGRCLFCTDCADACPERRDRIHRRLPPGRRARATTSSLEASRTLRPGRGARRRSCGGSSAARCKLRQVSAGGCNACEADVNVLSTVGCDLGRFGIQFVASPRHADGLLITGPVTQNMRSPCGRPTTPSPRRRSSSPSAPAPSPAARTSATPRSATAPAPCCRSISTSPAARRTR